ncbi:MAG TPA: hypothetical protein VF439_01105 [Candidatus Paceibacterota bacterium]
MDTATELPPLEWIFLATVQCPHCKQMKLKIYQARTSTTSALNQASKYECETKGCAYPVEITDPRIG